MKKELPVFRTDASPVLQVMSFRLEDAPGGRADGEHTFALWPAPGQCLAGRTQGQTDAARAAVPRHEPGGDLADRKPIQILGGKQGEWPQSRPSLPQSRQVSGEARTQRRDDANTGDRNPTHRSGPSGRHERGERGDGLEVLTCRALVPETNLVGELDGREQLECRQGIETQPSLGGEQWFGVTDVLGTDVFQSKGRHQELLEFLAKRPQRVFGRGVGGDWCVHLSLIHISEPTRLLSISYAVFCLKKKK